MESNYLFVGLAEGDINIGYKKGTCLNDLKDKLLERGVQVEGYYFTHNGAPITCDAQAIEGSDGLITIRAFSRIIGGKGGFGALIRSMGMHINKNRNKDASRDLSGRRMRDVEAEKKISEWMKKEPERKRQREEERKQRRRHLLEEPRHFFNDPKYMQQIESAREGVEDALKQGLQAGSSSAAKHTSQGEARPSKRPKLWMGVDPVLDSDLDSEGENEDNSESSPADQDSPGSSVETSLQDRAAADESSPTVEQQPEEHFTTDTIKDIPQPTISHESDTTPQPVISHESDGTPQTEASADGNAQADIVYEPINLEDYSTVEELETLGAGRLKASLQNKGLKCGGTLNERAQRLLFIKGKALDEISPSLFARPGKGKGKKRTKPAAISS